MGFELCVMTLRGESELYHCSNSGTLAVEVLQSVDALLWWEEGELVVSERQICKRCGDIRVNRTSWFGLADIVDGEVPSGGMGMCGDAHSWEAEYKNDVCVLCKENAVEDIENMNICSQCFDALK